MNAMRPPKLRAAFGELPLAESPAWTDLSTRLRAATVNRRIGEAGTVQLVLNNRDRALEAEYAGSPYYPDVTPNTRVQLDYQEDNLLDLDTSSAENSMGTVAATQSGSTVSRTTAQALHGSWSFLMTGNGGSPSQVGPSLTSPPATSRLPVANGDVVSVRASFRAATVGRSCSVGVRGFNASGSLVWSPDNQGTVTDTTTGWVEAVGVFFIPSSVTSIVAAAFVASAANGEQHYVDCLGVERPTIGPNLLTAEASSFETGLSPWVPSTTDVTVARTTTQAALGSWSLQITRNIDSVNDFGARHGTPRVPVIVGRRYLFRYQARAAATTRGTNFVVRWFNGDQHFDTDFGEAGNSFTTGWTHSGGFGVAPATATHLEWSATITGGGSTNGMVHYIDDAGVYEVTVPAAWTVGWNTVADAYVDSLPPSYTYGANGGDSVVTASCTDVTKFLARYPIRPPYEAEMRESDPKHWWPLGEKPGSTVMEDSGFGRANGAYVSNATLGEEQAVDGSSATAITINEAATYYNEFDHVMTNILGRARFPALTLWSAECVFTRVAGDRRAFNPLKGFGPYTNTTDPQLLATMSTIPLVTFLVYDDSGLGSTLISANHRLKDRRVHHIAVTFAANGVVIFYIDGSQVGTGTLVSPITLDSLGIGGASWGTNFDSPAGYASNYAVYDRVLTAAEVAAHADAANRPWEGDSTGERIGRILDQVGIPASWRDVSTGQTVDLAPVFDPLEGKRALDIVRKVEETEMGATFATADGSWRFIGRRDLTGEAAAATFGDATGEVPYVEVVPDYSEEDIIRTATVTREGGNPQTYTDPAASAGDAIFDGSRDGLLYATDGEAYDAATWLVHEHKDPHLKFRRMVLAGERSTTVMRQIAHRDLGDKVTVRRRPPGGGAALERTVTIVGITHDIDCQARTWRTSYELAAVDTTDYWTLEDAVLGQLDTSTVLAF